MTKTNPQEFFQQRRGLAEVKKEILPRFLPKWGEIRLPELAESRPEARGLIADLFAGQGITEEGTESAIPSILKAIFVSSGSRADLNKKSLCFLHDASKILLPLVKSQVESLPFYQELHQPPLFLQQEEAKVSWQEVLLSDQPALFFLDPFGYKLSQEVWYQALQRGKSDFIFFLDPKRLKTAVKNSKDDAFSAFLGENREGLQKVLQQSFSGNRKEETLVLGFEKALQQNGYFLTKFRINVPGKDQTEFYLCLVSKLLPLHTRFKEILLEYSDEQEDGVPRMGVHLKPLRLLVPEFYKYLPFSLENLENDLLRNTAVYQSMVLEKIYERHNVGTPYSRDNYFTVVQKLGEEGKAIFLNPKTAQTVRKLTFGCRVKFI